MIETLAQVIAPKFTAGMVLWDDKVVEVAPILRRMKGWRRDRVRDHCREKGWRISVVYQMERQRTYGGMDDRRARRLRQGSS